MKRALFPITLSEGLDVVAKRCRPGSQTPRWYKSTINTVIKKFGDIHVTKITAEMMTEWATDAKLRLSPHTSNSYIRAVKAFFNHLIAAGHLDESPAAHLRPGKPPRLAPKDISDEDIEKMVHAARYSARNHAMVLILRDTGCRSGGLLSMRKSLLHIEKMANGEFKGRALVTEKGEKQRFIFFGDEAARALLFYIESHPHDAPDYVWLNNSNTLLSGQGVYHALRKIANRAGVKRFNPHAFRHSLAKRMITNGAPAKLVSEILGHEEIQTTLDIYVTYNDNELQDLHSKYANYGKTASGRE